MPPTKNNGHPSVLRTIMRLLRRMSLGGRRQERQYVDLTGDSLYAHIVDHVFNPDEGWDRRIAGLNLDHQVPFNIQPATAFLKSGIRLEGIVSHIEETYGDDAELMFDYALCHKEFEVLEPLLPDDSEEAMTLLKATLSAFLLRERALEKDEWLIPTEFLGQLSGNRGKASRALKNAAERHLQISLINALIEHSKVRQLQSKKPLADKLLNQIEDIRNKVKLTPRIGGFFASFYQEKREARREVMRFLGTDADRIAAAYLDIGHEAMIAAGAKPRHCEYRRPYLKVGEGYVDDSGIAVCIGRAPDKSYQLFTIHVPTIGRSAKEKRSLSNNEQTFNTAASRPTLREAELFLEEFREGDEVSEQYSLPNWEGR